MSHVKACCTSILAEYAAACDTLGFGGEPAGSLNRRSSDGDVLKCVSILRVALSSLLQETPSAQRAVPF